MEAYDARRDRADCGGEGLTLRRHGRRHRIAETDNIYLGARDADRHTNESLSAMDGLVAQSFHVEEEVEGT